jgi:enoyl-CoA hydratase/carnithine racemase
MSEPIVEVERKGRVTVLTLMYRPYNLIGPTLRAALHPELIGAVEAGSRAVLIRSGLRHFCAGADVGLFSERMSEENAGAAPSRGANSSLETLDLFETLPIPIVASVHGVCLGGGLELALACDYVIAAASAKLGSVEVALGLHPLMGGIQRQVQRIGMARAKEMSMLGRRYDAATLERWGLINMVVPDEQLDSAAMTVAEELAAGPTIAHAATKKLARIAASEGVEAADRAMVEVQKPIWASEDLKAGLASFRANGPGLAVFEGR